ncbi:MAG: division/cell wall cluster transcriptional repressor MraZ [Lachnospiraceae bacterium]|nr:division/cell wall cluster transcriptional repressor MraZ [Lachnospiraceae bacterium]
MFMGEYNHTIDTKGRLSVPSKFRSMLGLEFVISKGIESCLYVYANDDWNQFFENIKSLSLINNEGRKFSRFFMSGAAQVELDPQGRILIPPKLREHAGLKKDVVLVGVGSRIEIWDSEKWEEECSRIDMEQITEAMEKAELHI